MMPTRLAVGLEPLNALDAAHRSPRSLPLSRKRNWFPRYARISRAIKQNKELSNLLSEKSASQAGNRSPPNCEVDQLRFPSQNRFPYGLQRTFNHLGSGNWPCHWRHRETVDARKRSRRLHHYHAARNRRSLCRHLDRSHLRGRELHRWLDHVDHRRNDIAFALSIDSQAKDVSDGVLDAPRRRRYIRYLIRRKRRRVALSREWQIVISSCPRRENFGSSLLSPLSILSGVQLTLGFALRLKLFRHS